MSLGDRNVDRGAKAKVQVLARSVARCRLLPLRHCPRPEFRDLAYWHPATGETGVMHLLFRDVQAQCGLLVPAVRPGVQLAKWLSCGVTQNRR